MTKVRQVADTVRLQERLQEDMIRLRTSFGFGQK